MPHTCSGEGEAPPGEDAASGTAVMMSAFATAGGGVGVAYTDTAFRNLGLLQFQDTGALADLEGVVVQVRKPSVPTIVSTICYLKNNAWYPGAHDKRRNRDHRRHHLRMKNNLVGWDLCKKLLFLLFFYLV